MGNRMFVVLFTVKNAVLVPLRAFSLKRSTAIALTVSVIHENYSFIKCTSVKRAMPLPLGKILDYLVLLLQYILDILLCWCSHYLKNTSGLIRGGGAGGAVAPPRFSAKNIASAA